MTRSIGSVLLVVSVIVVAASVGAGLFVLGSPSEERALRLDDRRVSDLHGIKRATDLYWTRNDALPESMRELSSEPGVRVRFRDPATGQPYDYQPLDSLRYEVCASFERESREIAMDRERDLWAHGPGRQCFRLEAEEVTERPR